MTKKDIDNLLKKGERAILECKKATGGLPDSVWQTYSAFANTNGGTILLGIEENLKAQSPDDAFIITGVPNPQQRIKDFWNTVNNPKKVNINILTNKDVDTIEYKGKTLICICVPQADYRVRPVYINNNPVSGTYKRNHEGDYHCSEKELRYMYRDSDDSGSDGILIENYTIKDLDEESIRAYRELFGQHNRDHIWTPLSNHDFLEKIGAIDTDRNTGKEWLTLAGLLMFGKGLAIRNRLSYLRMDYIDKTNLVGNSRWSDRLTYDGRWENNLFNFFIIVSPKLTFNLRRPFQLEGFARKEETLVHEAVREALTNSIIHADLCLEGLLKVVKTDNGFEFTNPGLLKIPAERIYQGEHTLCRNPRLQIMFRMLGYGENIGSGWSTILQAWKEARWPKPELTEYHDLLSVKLSLQIPAVTRQNVQKDVQKDVQKELSERQKHIHDLVIAEPRITLEGMSKKLKVSVKTIQREMELMRQNGFSIERKGGPKQGTWVITL